MSASYESCWLKAFMRKIKQLTVWIRKYNEKLNSFRIRGDHTNKYDPLNMITTISLFGFN